MRISSVGPALPEKLWRRGIVTIPIGHSTSLYLQETLSVDPLVFSHVSFTPFRG
jgi:hypothetical protein